MPKKITEDGEVLDIVTQEIIARAPPFWKTPFNHDTNAESDRTGLKCEDPTKTQQHLAAEQDINNILRKFMQTGELRTTGSPEYIDLVEEFDLQDKMVTAYQVDEAWNALPKEARAILQTPSKFVEWYDHCLETGNIDGLRDIGLIPPEKAQEPPKAPPTPLADPPAAKPGEKAPPEPQS